MHDTLTCPHCGATEAKLVVEAGATLTYRGTVAAEIDIAADLVRDTATLAFEQRKVVVTDYLHYRKRTLHTFCRDNDPHDLDLLDWHDLELDEELTAYCNHCQGDVTEQFKQLLDTRVPLETSVA